MPTPVYPISSTRITSTGASVSSFVPFDDTILKLPLHVNVRLMDDEDGAALEQYATNPKTPVRVWA